MAKKLAESRFDMAPAPKKEKVVEVIPFNEGKIIAITTIENGCDLTIRVSQPPDIFKLGQIIKI